MSLDPAPVVAAADDHYESNTGGQEEEIREEEMGDVESGSELTELDEEVMEEIRRKASKKAKQRDSGRPNFPRAQPGEGAGQTTQEFFRHGRASMPIGISSDDEYFASPVEGPSIVTRI